MRSITKAFMKKRLGLILIIALLATSCAVALCACDKGDPTYTLNYDAEGYEVGAAFSMDGVTALDIEWFAGEVRVTSDPQVDHVELRESSSVPDRGDALTMHALVKDGTLFVRCAAPGNYALEGAIVKSLSVRVPESLCFDSVCAKTLAANVYLQKTMSKVTDINSHSGAIIHDTAGSNMLTYPRKITLKTLTGEVWLNVLNNFVPEEESDGVVSVSTASGKANVKINAFVPGVRVKTSSGNQSLEINAAVFLLEIDTHSGLVDLKARQAPTAMNIESDCATLRLKLNKDDAFELSTDVRIAASFVDISKGIETDEGFKFVYEPELQIGKLRASYSIHGKNSVLYLEKVEV